MPRPPTSTAAHRRSLHSAEADRAHIVDLLWDTPDGLTTYEVEQRLGMLHQTASARMSELVRQNPPLVIQTLRTRPTSTGSKATVYTLAPYLRGLCRHCYGRGCLAPGCGGTACDSQ